MNNIYSLVMFKIDANSWYHSSRNVKYTHPMLEAELRSIDGTWKYNKLEIHPLLLNKPLINDNGIFKYQLSKEDDDRVMSALYPIYQGQHRPITIKNA